MESPTLADNHDETMLQRSHSMYTIHNDDTTSVSQFQPVATQNATQLPQSCATSSSAQFHKKLGDRIGG